MEGSIILALLCTWSGKGKSPGHAGGTCRLPGLAFHFQAHGDKTGRPGTRTETAPYTGTSLPKPKLTHPLKAGGSCCCWRWDVVISETEH